MSTSYENQLNEWVNKEKHVDLLNSVGTLMYDKDKLVLSK